MHVLHASVAASWQGVYRHPYFFQLLFVFLLSRIYSLNVVLGLGVLDLRRFVHDPGYVLPPFTHIFFPEFFSLDGAVRMVGIYLGTFFLVEASWKYGRWRDTDNLLSSALAYASRQLLRDVARCFHTGVMMCLAIQVLVILHDAPPKYIVLLSILTIVLACITWPLTMAVMVNRDARLKFARRVTVTSIVGALPVARRRCISADDDCAICIVPFGEIKGPLVKLPVCGHVFCNACVSSWVRTQDFTCPMCRHDFFDDLVAIIERPFKYAALDRLVHAALGAWDTLMVVVDGLMAALAKPMEYLARSPDPELGTQLSACIKELTDIIKQEAQQREARETENMKMITASIDRLSEVLTAHLAMMESGGGAARGPAPGFHT